MSPPTDSADFATDTNYSAPGEDWDGLPVKVDPGSSVRASGWIPDILPAEFLNWVLNVLGRWIAYFKYQTGGSAGTAEWLYGPGARARTVVIPGCRIQNGTGGATGWVANDNETATATAAGKFGIVDLGPELRSDLAGGGDTLTTVTVKVVARAATMAVKLYKFNHLTGARTQVGSTYNPAGTGSLETGSISASSLLIQRHAFSYYIQIVSSASASTGGSAEFLDSVFVEFTQPGPH